MKSRDAASRARWLKPPIDRRLAPQDAAALAMLWAEMQRHYGKPVTEAAAFAAATHACEAQHHGGFAPRILVAHAADGSLAGSIVLNVSFPANELSRSLYIRDLYVAAAMRRLGIARAMLRAAAALALAQASPRWTGRRKNPTPMPAASTAAKAPGCCRGSIIGSMPRTCGSLSGCDASLR